MVTQEHENESEASYYEEDASEYDYEAMFEYMRAENMISEKDDEAAFDDEDEADVGQPKGKPQKLTWYDLEYLWVNHGLGPSEIEQIPGFENFEITEEIKETKKNEQFKNGPDDILEESKIPHGNQEQWDYHYGSENSGHVNLNFDPNMNIPLKIKNEGVKRT